ncbi:thiolase family protein [Frankia tisae]|uniref:thiolase family protein n=1 Tax=Frankia tisae TaxID=2950104 RepID=UPI0034D3EB67
MASPLEPAVVGLGLTPMSLSAGGVPVDLAIEAVASALADAGLTRGDVDGLLVNSSQGVRPDRLGVALARQGGLGDLRLLEHVEIKGATAAAMIQRAVLAIRAGLARTVICVFADAPLRAGGTSGSTYAHSGGNDGARGLERASGVLGSVPTYALLASRYFAVSGGDPEDLCAVAVSTRAWALGNPDAVVRKPLDAEGYFASRMVSAPLRVLDCARPVNGAVALVVSGEATPGQAPRVHVRGMGQAHPMRRRRAPGESWFGGGRAAVDGALAMAGLTRSDLDVIELYDPFSVVTLLLLEEYGLVEPGQAGKVVRSGATAPGGDLPVNTGGGQLSGFYLQGMTPLAEAVVQLRGAGGARQVPGASTALVGGIGGRVDHHACLILDLEPSR